MQSCRKSSLGTETITSSFSPFRSHPFITFHFIPPQSHIVTNPLPYHNKMLLFLALLQKNQAEALVKKSACCFTPICCLLDSKKQKQQTGQNWQPKEITETTWGTKYLCQKNKSSLLLVASLYIQLMTPNPHSSVEQAQQTADYKVHCKWSVLCVFDSSFITPEWSERYTGLGTVLPSWLSDTAAYLGEQPV